MKYLVLALASMLSINASACEMGDICVGSPDIVTNVPAIQSGVMNAECHVWSFYSDETVNMAAVAGSNLMFSTIQIKNVSWAGKDLVITGYFNDRSQPASFNFARLGTSGTITSQCHLLVSNK